MTKCSNMDCLAKALDINTLILYKHVCSINHKYLEDDAHE